MTIDLILTIVAKDKPGVVQTVARLVAEHDGNWMESSLVRLGGEFAGIARVALPKERLGLIRAALAQLAHEGIAVTVNHQSSIAAPAGGRSAQLTLTGIDHPGIVRDISAALAANGINIDALQTQLFPGSMTGEHMFSASARIVIPITLSAEVLRHELERLAQDVMVDIDLSAPEDEGGR